MSHVPRQILVWTFIFVHYIFGRQKCFVCLYKGYGRLDKVDACRARIGLARFFVDVYLVENIYAKIHDTKKQLWLGTYSAFQYFFE